MEGQLPLLLQLLGDQKSWVVGPLKQRWAAFEPTWGLTHVFQKPLRHIFRVKATPTQVGFLGAWVCITFLGS